MFLIIRCRSLRGHPIRRPGRSKERLTTLENHPIWNTSAFHKRTRSRALNRLNQSSYFSLTLSYSQMRRSSNGTMFISCIRQCVAINESKLSSDEIRVSSRDSCKPGVSEPSISKCSLVSSAVRILKASSAYSRTSSLTFLSSFA